MNQGKRPQIIVTQRYSAAPEKVFDAFLDVKVARRFLFATETGEMIVAEVDARVGGKFTFTDRRPEMGDVQHLGEYLEIDRPRRLVFTFAVPKFSSEISRVTVEIQPDQKGSLLTLTHDNVLPEFTERAREGWGKILAKLQSVFEEVHSAC